MMNRTATLAHLFCALAATGCIDGTTSLDTEAADVDTTQPADEPSLLMEIPTAGGTVVELYEVEPGVILVSETAPHGVAGTLPRDRASMTANELFEAVRAEGVEPTDRLRAALATAQTMEDEGVLPRMFDHRDDVIGPRTDIVEPDSVPLAITLRWNSYVKETYSSTAFMNMFCDDNDWQWCELDEVGSSSKTRNDVISGTCTVATVQNTAKLTLSIQPWWDWDVLGSWTVSKGYWRSVHVATNILVDDYDLKCSVSTKNSCALFDYACIVSTPKAVFHHAGDGTY